MSETIMNKVNELSRELFEVLPLERVQKLAHKILVRPMQRAVKKIEQDDTWGKPIQESFKEAIDDFYESLTPESLSLLICTILAQKMYIAKATPDLVELLNDLDIKQTIKKFVDTIEKHADKIGRIVERCILLSHEIKTDLDNKEE